jgi:hypothetical protein
MIVSGVASTGRSIGASCAIAPRDGAMTDTALAKSAKRTSASLAMASGPFNRLDALV